MKRFVILPGVLLAALVLAAAGLADPGDKGKGKGKKQGHNRFTFTLVTEDNGCHGTPWASDTLTRTYVVHDNGNGTFRVTRRVPDRQAPWDDRPRRRNGQERRLPDGDRLGRHVQPERDLRRGVLHGRLHHGVLRRRRHVLV